MVVGIGTVLGAPPVAALGIELLSTSGGLSGLAASLGGTAGGAAAVGSGAATGASTAVASISGQALAGTFGSALPGGAGVAGAALKVAANAAFQAGYGAAVGAAEAIASGAASAGAMSGAATAATLTTPLGLAIVGADGYTWDCWKAVVLDESIEPSCGIALRDLYNHPNLRRMTIDSDGFVAENIRGEHFRLYPVHVDGSLAFHATPV
ncbi:hypothetical protein DIS24_g11925 [Lasiodiplodia hormozganensis]|uniref:Uncharacterized protein n=1 Tax=Lasiodiplodia hormozganensis TaxID=869390 RepID=A0AA39WG70_9PEZI|nr:hypothetical protein DIS24_g11925 [Lasiodiplodia hormozganensis]